MLEKLKNVEYYFFKMNRYYKRKSSLNVKKITYVKKNDKKNKTKDI